MLEWRAINYRTTVVKTYPVLRERPGNLSAKTFDLKKENIKSSSKKKTQSNNG